MKYVSYMGWRNKFPKKVYILLSLLYNMGKVMSSRALKNLMHLTGTTLACLLYFSGYYQGDGRYSIALLLILAYIALGRITSELAYRVDLRLLEEKVQK